MTARAYSGVAVIILEFDVNFNKQKALEDVRAQVDEARSLLPQEADPPSVQELNVALQPVISVALSGNVPERTLLKLARDLKDEIKLMPSVLDVDIDGERKEHARDRHRSGQAGKPTASRSRNCSPRYPTTTG